MVTKKAVDDLISVAEAARIRNVTHGAIRDLINRGRLSAVEVGGRRFVSRSEVKAYKPEKGGRGRKVGG